jgi:hypothetical protein
MPSSSTVQKSAPWASSTHIAPVSVEEVYQGDEAYQFPADVQTAPGLGHWTTRVITKDTRPKWCKGPSHVLPDRGTLRQGVISGTRLGHSFSTLAYLTTLKLPVDTNNSKISPSLLTWVVLYHHPPYPSSPPSLFLNSSLFYTELYGFRALSDTWPWAFLTGLHAISVMGSGNCSPLHPSKAPH